MPAVQSPQMVDVANPENIQGHVHAEILDDDDEYRGPCLYFQIPSQETQYVNPNQYQASQFAYPGANSIPMLPYAHVNPALQYVQSGAPLAHNAQIGGSFPQAVNVAP